MFSKKYAAVDTLPLLARLAPVPGEAWGANLIPPEVPLSTFYYLKSPCITSKHLAVPSSTKKYLEVSGSILKCSDTVARLAAPRGGLGRLIWYQPPPLLWKLHLMSSQRGPFRFIFPPLLRIIHTDEMIAWNVLWKNKIKDHNKEIFRWYDPICWMPSIFWSSGMGVKSEI